MSFVPETCRRASDILLAAAADSPDPELMTICARSLVEIADACPAYNEQAILSKKFLEEGHYHTRMICEKRDTGTHVLYDLAFALFECIAVASRENYPPKTTRKLPPNQDLLLRYFESSDHWRPDDDTLITYYYYIVIPNAVSITQ